MRRLIDLFAVFFALSMGCSLGNFDRAPCTSEADCTSFGSQATCVDGYCAGETNTPDGGTPPQQLKLGFVYSSSETDRGWSQTHHQGAQRIAARFNLDLDFIPSVQGMNVEAAIDTLINDNEANVIFTPSSGYISGTLQAANKYPDATFFSCCGDASGPNLNSYRAKMYQPIYVLGYVAGRMSCTGRLGVVAALGLPEFVRHINAFTLGAQEANPNIEVDVRWVGAFFDPPTAIALSEDLMDKGADVILAQSNSTGAVEARMGATVTCDGNEVPVYRVGYHSPTACEANPAQCLGAAYWKWGGVYEDKMQALIDGTLDFTNVDALAMNNSVDSPVAYTDLNAAVSVLISSEADMRKAATIANPQVPFIGPMNDNTGAGRIAPDQVLTDDDFSEMCWFVDGVISSESGADSPAVVPSLCGGI